MSREAVAVMDALTGFQIGDMVRTYDYGMFGDKTIPLVHGVIVARSTPHDIHFAGNAWQVDVSAHHESSLLVTRDEASMEHVRE